MTKETDVVECGGCAPPIVATIVDGGECGTCRERIRADTLTGTACACAAAEPRARELLAAQFEAEGFALTAADIRNGTADFGTSVRAIARAHRERPEQVEYAGEIQVMVKDGAWEGTFEEWQRRYRPAPPKALDVEALRDLRAFAAEAREAYARQHASGTFRAIVKKIDAILARLPAPG